MIVYYLMFFYACIPAFQGHNSSIKRLDGSFQLSLKYSWLFIRIMLFFLIGFRLEVGGDWFTYIGYLERARYVSFLDVMQHADPGYVLLNVLSDRLNLGITGVNALSAVIVVFGLFGFLQSLPRPWLGLACAIPYLVIVVAMGYTRQSVALGLVMLAMVAMKHDRFRSYIMLVILGASFHKTAILLLPLAALVSTRRRIQKMGVVGLATVMGFEMFLSGHGQRLYDVYISSNLMDSDGALIRLLMNAIPGGLFILLARRLEMPATEKSFWNKIAWVSIFMFLVFFVTDLSTALDRMALYFIPLQMVVFAYLPDILKGSKRLIVLLVLMYYFLILTVWLNFATHAKYWLPYQFGFG